MKIFITGTNTDVGKTYIVKHLFQLLQSKGHTVCIFKPLQTEEIEVGKYPDLEIYRNECALDYELTSLYKFKNPVSPHLAFKQEPSQTFKQTRILDRLDILQKEYEFILIEGAGGIGVPLYEKERDFYMTVDLIKVSADLIISVIPAKLGAISDAVVHQHYVDSNQLPANVLLMNEYCGTEIEKDNKVVIEKLTQRHVFTFPAGGTAQDFHEDFIKALEAI